MIGIISIKDAQRSKTKNLEKKRKQHKAPGDRVSFFITHIRCLRWVTHYCTDKLQKLIYNRALYMQSAPMHSRPLPHMVSPPQWWIHAVFFRGGGDFGGLSPPPRPRPAGSRVVTEIYCLLPFSSIHLSPPPNRAPTTHLQNPGSAPAPPPATKTAAHALSYQSTP